MIESMIAAVSRSGRQPTDDRTSWRFLPRVQGHALQRVRFRVFGALDDYEIVNLSANTVAFSINNFKRVPGVLRGEIITAENRFQIEGSLVRQDAEICAYRFDMQFELIKWICKTF